MLKYQIHKLSKGEKETRAVLLEDILTSDVFGIMSYFPYDLLLQPFLELVKLKNPKSHFSVPAVEPVQVHFWKSFSWPESLPNIGRDSIEPDVLIEWNDVLLVIEAKFISPTDPEELLREYLIGATEARTEQKFFLLLVDKNLSLPNVAYSGDKITIWEYIGRRIQDLNISEKYSPEKVHSSFLWINWQSFYELVERLLHNNMLNEMADNGWMGIKILGDLLLILERKGLTPFEILSLGDFAKCQISLDSLGQIGLMINSSFSEFSDISIDIDTLGNTGLILSDPIKYLSKFDLDQNSIGDVGLMIQGTFSDLSDISIDIKALGKIGLIINDPAPFLGGFWLDTDILRTVLA